MIDEEDLIYNNKPIEISEKELEKRKKLEKLIKSNFSKDEIENINNSFKTLLSNEKLSLEEKGGLLESQWKLNYWKKPPSPQEFLTEDYLGAMADDIYPHIKEAFIEFFNPIKNYREIDLYFPIGAGKTTLVSIIKLYIAVLVYYMRDPRQFFRLAKSTVLFDVSISLTKEQAFSLVLKPLQNLMNTSPLFEKVKFEHDLDVRRKQEPNKIFWSNTSKGSSVMRIGDVYYNVVSSPEQLLGLNIINFSATELAFLCETMSEEKVLRLLSDGRGRIFSRFGNSFLAKLIVDSSPNSLENAIDRYLYNDCRKDPTKLFLTSTKWGIQPYLFPEWEKDKENNIFKVYIGNYSTPPKILEKGEEENYDITTILEMPIDIKQLAIENLSKILKDYGAIPSSSSDEKLISNTDIIENMFTEGLRNHYSFIQTSASQVSEGLLWNIFKNVFWTYTGRGNLYTFYRNPNEERFVSIDLAKNHDMASISMCHLERKGTEKIYVIDFSIVVMAKKGDEINMESFRFFITDMVKYGGMLIKHISLDGYQSETTLQFLKRLNFEAEKLSVDISIEPYMSFISYMGQGRVKCGKNLILKNNLKSLIKTTTKGKSRVKIDHVLGEWVDLNKVSESDWETSRAGYFGKDCSDSICACISLADKYGSILPECLYELNEDEERKRVEDPIGSIENSLLDVYGLTFM